MLPGMGRLSRPPPPNSLSRLKNQKRKIKKKINTQTFLKDKEKRKLEKARRKLEQSGQPSLIGKIKGIFTGVGNSILDQDRKTKLQNKLQKMTEKLHRYNQTINSIQSSKNIVKKEIENIKRIRNDEKTQKKITDTLEKQAEEKLKKTKKNKKTNNLQPQKQPNNTTTKTNLQNTPQQIKPSNNTQQPQKQPNASTKTNLSNTQQQIKPSNNTSTKPNINTNLPKINNTTEIKPSNNQTRKNKKIYIKGQTQGSTSINGLSMREKRKEKSELKRIIKGININYNSKGKTYEDILKDYETLRKTSKNTNNMSVLNPRLFNKKSTQNSTNV